MNSKRIDLAIVTSQICFFREYLLSRRKSHQRRWFYTIMFAPMGKAGSTKKNGGWLSI